MSTYGALLRKHWPAAVRAICFSIPLLSAPLAYADDWRVNGFGTLGYAVENKDDIGFFRNSNQPSSTEWDGSFRPDSILGVQGSYTFNPQFEAVAQLVYSGKAKLTPANAFEWAFLAYRPNENTDLRVGRVGLDVFMLSDYRNLGYSQLWVRPPREFYGWLPLFSLDGGDIAYSFSSGDTRWRIKGQYGRSRADVPMPSNDVYRFETNNFRDITLQAENGPWQFKAGYAALTVASQPPIGELTGNLDALIDAGLGPISDEAASLRRQLQIEGTKVSYASLGAAYDDGKWVAQTEFARLKGESALMQSGDAAYASLGYRIGAYTPYAVIGRFKPDRARLQATNDWSMLGAQALQDAAIASTSAVRLNQRTVSFGMRWDLSNSTALKLQWDRTHVMEGSYGQWQTPLDRALPDDMHINLYSLTLDFVF